jgi:hypothetical protein
MAATSTSAARRFMIFALHPPRAPIYWEHAYSSEKHPADILHHHHPRRRSPRCPSVCHRCPQDATVAGTAGLNTSKPVHCSVVLFIGEAGTCGRLTMGMVPAIPQPPDRSQWKHIGKVRAFRRARGVCRRSLARDRCIYRCLIAEIVRMKKPMAIASISLGVLGACAIVFFASVGVIKGVLAKWL